MHWDWGISAWMTLCNLAAISGCLVCCCWDTLGTGWSAFHIFASLRQSTIGSGDVGTLNSYFSHRQSTIGSGDVGTLNLKVVTLFIAKGL